MRLRQDALDGSLAGSAPQPAAAHERFRRLVHVEGVAGRRIHKALDAARDMRNRGIGSSQPIAAAPPKPITQTIRMPARKNKVPQPACQHGLSKSGCSTRALTAAGNSATQRIRRHFRPPRGFAEQPGDQNDEGGLEDSEG